MASRKESLSSDGNTSSVPLLDEKDYNDDLDYVPARRNTGLRIWPFVIHILIFFSYTAAFFVMRTHYERDNCHKSLIYSPARSAIKYERVEFNNNPEKQNLYKGHPRPEHDEAWKKLLQNSNIRISGDTLRKLNRTSIQLSDGSGDYFGGLNVHHHLHCLKSVRHYIHSDYYGIPEDDMKWTHLDHCLEDIRQTVMCNADFSVLTYDWLPDYKKPWANFQVAAECVNWESLDGWARDQAFSLFDQKSVVHPTLGLSWPRVNGTIVNDMHTHPKVVPEDY